MSIRHAALLRAHPTPPSEPDRRQLRWAHASILAALMLIVLLYLPTISTMVEIWQRSPTFNHGFLIVPVTGWLIWRRRGQHANVPRQPWPMGFALLMVLGMIWLLAAVANVKVLQQYCVMLICIASVATILGKRFAKAIGFALAYLLLAVPFGEVFIPPLIDFTAGFTVLLLQLSGIPVYHDHNFISLPSGNWAVVEACSGLRYLIASVALGVLYSCVNYQRTGKRLSFIAVSVVVPIIANGLRACMVVLIGHWSGMELATGIDHLIYGWLFFGLVMLLLFWTGARWRDHARATAPASTAPVLGPATSAPPAQFLRIAGAVVALCAVWPALAAYVQRSTPPDTKQEPILTLGLPPAPWFASPLRPGDWQMPYQGQPQRILRNYDDGRRTVSLQLTWYRHQSDRAELLATVGRTVISGAPSWEEVQASYRTINIGGRQLQVRASVQQAAHDKLLVWRWYRQAGVETASPQLLKLLLAKSRLLGGSDSGAEIIVAAGYDEQTAPAEAAMHDLLTAMLPAIDQGLNHVER